MNEEEEATKFTFVLTELLKKNQKTVSKEVFFENGLLRLSGGFLIPDDKQFLR